MSDEPLFICGHGPASGPPGSVHGEPPTDDGKCPKCGAGILSGYGLAFGGMGVYHYCESDDCEWFYKVQDADEEAASPSKGSPQ
jgi:hypothetical protein